MLRRIKASKKGIASGGLADIIPGKTDRRSTWLNKKIDAGFFEKTGTSMDTRYFLAGEPVKGGGEVEDPDHSRFSMVTVTTTRASWWWLITPPRSAFWLWVSGAFLPRRKTTAATKARTIQKRGS